MKVAFTFKNLNKKRGNILQSNQDIDLILKNIIANNDYLMIKDHKFKQYKQNND